MSDTEKPKEVAIIQEPIKVPSQVSATDTSNQDIKISTDPGGEKYIKSLDEADQNNS